MAHIIRGCWLSPTGDVYWCDDEHFIQAKQLVEKFYNDVSSNLSEAGMPVDVQNILYSKGWIKYVNHSWDPYSKSGWYIPLFGRKSRTQAQIDKIYELTGDVVDDEWKL